MSDVTNNVNDGNGNISLWDQLQISSKPFGSIFYGDFPINVYEHTDNFHPIADSKKKRYFYSPMALVNHESVTSNYNGVPGQAAVRFRIELWNEMLEKKIAEFCSDLTGTEVKPARVKVIPFEKAILFTSSPNKMYQLSKNWTRYQGQKSLWFTIISTTSTTVRVVMSIHSNPEKFSDLKLLYGMNSQPSTDMLSVAVNFTTESGLKSENQFSYLQSQLDDAKGEIEVLKKRVSAILKDKKNVVIFDAYRSSNFDSIGNATVTYDGTNVNVGNGMDINTGIFTAPVAGVYSFEFHGNTKEGLVYLQLNGETRATFHARSIPVSCSGTLQLKTGDKVSIVFALGNLHDSPSDMLTHFSGRLL